LALVYTCAIHASLPTSIIIVHTFSSIHLSWELGTIEAPPETKHHFYKDLIIFQGVLDICSIFSVIQYSTSWSLSSSTEEKSR
jgi:hypothetical protein